MLLYFYTNPDVHSLEMEKGGRERGRVVPPMPIYFKKDPLSSLNRRGGGGGGRRSKAVPSNSFLYLHGGMEPIMYGRWRGRYLHQKTLFSTLDSDGTAEADYESKALFPDKYAT